MPLLLLLQRVGVQTQSQRPTPLFAFAKQRPFLLCSGLGHPDQRLLPLCLLPMLLLLLLCVQRARARPPPPRLATFWPHLISLQNPITLVAAGWCTPTSAPTLARPTPPPR